MWRFGVCGGLAMCCVLWRSRLLSLSLRLSQAEASKEPVALFTSPSSLKIARVKLCRPFHEMAVPFG